MTRTCPSSPSRPSPRVSRTRLRLRDVKSRPSTPPPPPPWPTSPSAASSSSPRRLPTSPRDRVEGRFPPPRRRRREGSVPSQSLPLTSPRRPKDPRARRSRLTSVRRRAPRANHRPGLRDDDPRRAAQPRNRAGSRRVPTVSRGRESREQVPLRLRRVARRRVSSRERRSTRSHARTDDAAPWMAPTRPPSRTL